MKIVRFFLNLLVPCGIIIADRIVKIGLSMRMTASSKKKVKIGLIV